MEYDKKCRDFVMTIPSGNKTLEEKWKNIKQILKSKSEEVLGTQEKETQKLWITEKIVELINQRRKYIYKPSGYHSETVRLDTKLTRSFLCFTFIFIWHGLTWEVFLWTVFNFIGITLETLARFFGKSSYYSRYIKCNLSESNERRFLAFITCPLTMLSAISNFFFFGGLDAGISYFEAIFVLNTWMQNIIIIIIFYSMCQISMEFNHYQKTKKKQKFNQYF
ncbi:Membrane bound O-acyl transferase, MBOAT [Cinara cedri]|uniref:Membrane bound O-acyl transferase, MBOAT n=1 Tax=Cinara cedri TaxID=506608 RepID=A0A5E4MT29_9HEMI|nr:Membrane bound O-acyl transferase, MBOAT [Cinara cedri]